MAAIASRIAAFVLSVLMPFVVLTLFLVADHVLAESGYADSAVMAFVKAVTAPISVGAGFVWLARAFGPVSSMFAIVYFPIVTWAQFWYSLTFSAVVFHATL